MKRKSLIKSCLLGAALLLGTGYAIINNKEVTINGTVSSENRNINVEFSGFKNDYGNIIYNQDNSTVTINMENIPYYQTVSASFNFVSLEEDIDVVLNVVEFFEGINREIFEPQPLVVFVLEDGEVSYHTTLSSPDDEVILEPGVVYGLSIELCMMKEPITEEESTSVFSLKMNFTPAHKNN